MLNIKDLLTKISPYKAAEAFLVKTLDMPSFDDETFLIEPPRACNHNFSKVTSMHSPYIRVCVYCGHKKEVQ